MSLSRCLLRFITSGLEVMDVPLAAVHKARLQWLESTDAMLEESKKWLADHNYQPDHFTAPPLTPEKRDADRVLLGKKPLKEQSDG